MKDKFKLLFPFLFCFLLTGCFNKEVLSCNTKSTNEYYVLTDVVNITLKKDKFKSFEKISVKEYYDTTNIANYKEFSKEFAKVYDKQGINYKIKSKNNKVTEILKASKKSIKKAPNDNDFAITIDKKKKSFKEYFEQLGYSCKIK